MTGAVYFWAGGNATRWFVKRRQPSPFVGHPDEESLIWEFASADCGGEFAAAHCANLLADRLNR